MNKSDMEILAKEEAEAMKLAQEEDAAQAAANANPAPVVTPEPPPAPAPNIELTAIQNEVAELKARNAELTQRLNSEDGRRGGELRSLREAVEVLKAQNQALAENNRKLSEATKQPDPPPAPVDDEEDKAFIEHFPKRAQREKALEAARQAEMERIRKAALEAQQKAEALERQSMDAATTRFTAAVQSRVPEFMKLIKDPAFCSWSDSTLIKGTGMTYGQSYDNAAGQLDANTAAEVLEAYLASQKANEPPPPVVDPSKPPKPTKEAQAIPDSAGGGAAPTPDASKVKASKAARLAELDYKLGLTGHPRTATIAESQEWDRLTAEIAASM